MQSHIEMCYQKNVSIRSRLKQPQLLPHVIAFLFILPYTDYTYCDNTHLTLSSNMFLFPLLTNDITLYQSINKIDRTVFND